MNPSGEGRRAWRFYRAGGVDQVLLAEAADLLALPQLDQRLWVALACPVKGLEFDERTLALLDLDHDGRVRAPELLATVAWLERVLAEPAGLVLGQDGVPLAALRSTHAEGQALRACAHEMLALLGRPEAAAITVAEAGEAAARWARARCNGDGVVPPEALDDEAARRAAEDCLRCVGGALDRSGSQGITAASIATFFAQLAEHAAWRARAQAAAREVLPLGEGTAAASAAVEALAAKVDDWFVRARTAAFDARARAALEPSEQAYLEAGTQALARSSTALRQLPLARLDPSCVLDLGGAANPAWQAELDALRTQAVEPLLGRGTTRLDEAAWQGLRARLAPHRAWAATRAGAAVEALGLPRVQALLASDLRARLEQAVADDLAAAPRMEQALQVERLARCWRDLFRLASNFVSFSDFYARRKAIFQAGTLYLDARTTDLCVQVLDAGKHATLAAKSGTYLVYVECTRTGGERMTVACAMTAGDSDTLFVGRNGVFYDRRGRDWDATITKIVDNPISVGQAFWSPYKKLARWAEDIVARRAAAADEEAAARMQATTTAAASGTTVAVALPKPKIDVGVVAALGVAVGGITAALGALLQAFFGLGVLMPLGILGAMMLVSGPAMFVAWLKLRKRNLGPILDANGWAVNTHTRINIPLGRSLTTLAELPEGSTRSLVDPFAPRKSAWRWLLPLLLLAGVALYGAWKLDLLHAWLDFVPPPSDPWLPRAVEVVPAGAPQPPAGR